MSLTTLRDAEAQIYEFGLEPNYILIDGRFHRCIYAGEKKSRMSGFYKLKEIDREKDVLVDGIFGSFRVSERPFVIERRVKLNYTNDKIEQLRKKQNEIAKQKQDEENEIKEAAAKRAEYIWEGLYETGQSRYLERKKVGAYGIKFKGETIVVPMCKDGNLCSLQSILADGTKKFLQGGNTKGVYHLIIGSNKVALCEGYATGATIYEATGWTVAICFSTNGLISAAPSFKNKNCVICSDNDRETELRTGKNPGVIAAQKAAEILQCEIIIPDIKNLTQTDFNDIHVFCGIDEVRKQCSV